MFAGFVALSNGELIEQRKPRKRGAPWAYHFKMDRPHSSYLVTLVIGRFQVLEDRPAERGDGLSPVPVLYYVPPGRAEDGRRAFRETPRMIELFGRLTGVPYPYSRYSQIVVSDFIFGGMGPPPRPRLRARAARQETRRRDLERSVAHELAHSGSGLRHLSRMVTRLLNEGFATLFEHVERGGSAGPREYDYGVAGDIDAYLAEAKSRYQATDVCRDYKSDRSVDRHLYEKGGLVCTC